MNLGRMGRVAAVVSIVAILGSHEPARAGFFKHVEPTPPPAGKWNFVSTPFKAFAIPETTALTVTARCRYVAVREPYVWQFSFHNETPWPLTFKAALIQINNGRFATVPQIYTTVERSSVRDLSIAAKGDGTIEEPGRFGCPGMDGGVNRDKHYVVIVDDIVLVEKHVAVPVVSGVFDAYDRKIVQERRAYADSVGSAMAGGASAGLDAVFGSASEYEVPTTGE